MAEKFKEIDIQSLLGQEQEGSDQNPAFHLGIRQIHRYLDDNGNTEDAYTLQVSMGKRSYIRQYTLSQITKRKFLQEFAIDIDNESKFYQKLRKEILQMEFPDEYISYETYRNGLQKVNGKWMYVFGNGSIHATGFYTNIKSRIGGIYFPPDKICEKAEYIKNIKELFHIYKANPSVFYPLFFINIMAITNGFFKEIGEDSFMRLSLWLDGESGSGKTELAKAGTYAFGDKEFCRKVLASVTGKRKDILTMLLQSSGCVSIIDDVKQEDVRDRRNSVKNNVDDCLRSVFQGCLTDSVSGYPNDKKIDCCAIITGEYMETKESQNARMIYIRADGFLKKEQNAKALRKLQENPTLFASVCGGYIEFLLLGMEGKNFLQSVKTVLKEKRDAPKVYQGISNAERLNENRCMLEMAECLTESYFHFLGMQETFLNEFCQYARKSIHEVIDATFYLLGGGQMVFLKAIERVLLKAKVRKAYYQTNFGRYTAIMYQQRYFWIEENYDDFIWIEDYGKSMIKNEDEKHYDYEEKPVLLIQKVQLERLFQKEVDILLKEKAEISSKIAESVKNQFWKLLREMQIIYQIPRKDSKLGRMTAEYPVFSRLFAYSNTGLVSEVSFAITYESVVQINTEHECVRELADRMNRTKAKKIHEKAERWTIIDKRELSENDEEVRLNEHDVFDKRQKFIKGKSLYRK